MFNSHKITYRDYDYDSIDKVGKNLHHNNLESPIHKHGMSPVCLTIFLFPPEIFKEFFMCI